ncbi:unnamed protein product [Onchocerca flexuosa]|uniref:Large ribosomal subunit protein P2 n=1 Tax=Onchocerca flexuosa TaxID=387005 RepID=A0A183HKG4_9BILA|nr:unnamed protein product [Onchocerca flexuosa]
MFPGTTMKYLAAYLLSTMGGNKSPTAKDIENVLGSVGLDVDMEDANKVVSALSGKSIDEVIAAGLTKISSVPSGSAASAAAPVASTIPTGTLEAESKKGIFSVWDFLKLCKLLFLLEGNVFSEEKKEEPKEESDEDMGFGLFD